MRGGAVAVALVLALAGIALAQPCAAPEHVDIEGRAREGKSISIGLKAVEVLKGLIGATVFGFTFTSETIDLRYRCTCEPFPPCCPTFVQATIFTTPKLQGPLPDPHNPFRQTQLTATLIPSEEYWLGPWVDKTGEKPVCHKEHYQVGSLFGGTLTVGVRVGTPLVGVTFTLASSRSTIFIGRVCFCNEQAWCEGNRAPTLSGPHYFTVPFGGSNELVLTATDSDGADDIADFRVYKIPEGFAVQRGEVKKISPDSKQITFIVSGPSSWQRPNIAQPLEVEVVDRCNNKAVLAIPVGHQGFRPILSLEESEQRDGSVWLFFRITDKDWGENFLVRVEPTGGTAVYPKRIDCRNFARPCEITFGVVFTPAAGASERHVAVTVTDFYGLESNPVVWHNPNRPPVVEVAPREVKVKLGEAVQAAVRAIDPDGDPLTLAKISGPGSFPTVEGKGSASGTYTWSADGVRAWHLVAFNATDRLRETGIGYLLIRVLQPPRVYGGYATVPRGGTTTASLYVSDPDTPPERLTFTFRAPPGLSVRLVSVEEPPYYYGSYYGYTARVQVSVDRGVCPGTYAVPFTVTDPDGLSSSATLHVHVWGNQPPRAEGELRGEMTVTLTPGGAVYSPLVMRVPVHDPDGDRVYVEGYGFPPTYAANLSFFLGSLVATYWPYPEAGGEFCRAVRERDVIVDGFAAVPRTRA